MASQWLPKVRVAACNVAPVFLDTAATVQKTIGLIREAASNRADLVVFPETHIPAFPLWAAFSAPIDSHSLFHRLASQSLLIDGPEIAKLRDACKQSRVWSHVGFNERSKASVGCIWNASVLIDDEGRVRNHHRKMVPTFWEKLVWANGDGSGLRVVESERLGRVGSLICGENTNPLARFALMAQGEQIHISSWPAVWPTRRASPPAASTTTSSSPSTTSEGKQYDNVSANLTRAAAHCFEAKCFGILCSGVMDSTMKSTILSHTPSAAETLETLTQGQSCFLDPTGARAGDVVGGGEEGIAYADLDLGLCVEPKQFHDVVGGYQRFDVFGLKVDRRRRGVDGMFGDGEREGLDVSDEETKAEVPEHGGNGASRRP